MTVAERFGRLSTAAKLLLILTAVLLPIGVGLTWIGELGIRSANNSVHGRTVDQSRAAAGAVESLIARNALALRIAANAALAGGRDGVCERMATSLAIAPAVARQFELEDENGKPLCAIGGIGETSALQLVAPGSISVHVSSNSDAVAIRVGVIGGMATSAVPRSELRTAVGEWNGNIQSLVLRDDLRQMPVFDSGNRGDQSPAITEWPIGRGPLVARIGVVEQRVTTLDRLLLLLPVMMWVAAALLTWLLVSRLLIRPLRRLERAVIGYAPGQSELDLPTNLGPSAEIQQLRDAFERAIARVDRSERDMADALEGQRRLVREVHHRVKNNLQVVASLLNIHGRTADAPGVRAAYAGIGRRVGALSMVHRNHFAEMEESRGIALRPLLSELAAELRAGAPEEARGLVIELDLGTTTTTQDIAVAVAFLVTEIIEHAMLNAPSDPVEISLRRTSDLTARLTLSSPVLVPSDSDDVGKVQFERIIGGLAKQLRSPLERKLGRYSVDLPVFPPA